MAVALPDELMAQPVGESFDVAWPVSGEDLEDLREDVPSSVELRWRSPVTIRPPSGPHCGLRG